MGKEILVASAAVVLLLTLSGCTEPPPPIGAMPSPTETPVFASDEEALAAAEAAYAKYLEVSDAILIDGGEDANRVAPYVTEEWLEGSVDSFEKFAERDLHTNGRTGFDGMVLTRYDSAGVDVYVCIDLSQVRVFDNSGEDVTPADREDRLPLEIGFEISERALLISRSDTWSGETFC